MEKEQDNINSPSYYFRNGVECRQWTKMCVNGICRKTGLSETATGWLVQALQYLWRFPFKNGIDDLYKAIRSIEYIIEELKQD